MIGLVVWQMNLEQVEATINGVDQANAPGQKVEGADAAVGQAANPVRNFVMNVAGREHGLIEIGHDCLIQASLDATLAVGEFSPYDLFHSKSLLASDVEVCSYSSDARKMRGFRVFSENHPGQHSRIRLFKA